MAQITLNNIHKRFNDFVAVKDSSFTINDGEFFVLLGPSGCGKTTTLRMIAGLELPTSGQITLDGDDVSFLRASQRDIAFVFQLFALYPHMNVQQNLAYPLRSEGVVRKEVKQRVEEIAKLLRIEHLLKKSVSGLAGGDRQRVALGRSIIRRPKAFLMDEPLGTLDSEFRELMCEELKQLHNRISATTVYVTHDQLEAMAMADKIAVMSQGEVLQVSSPTEIYHKPKWKFVANFIGTPAMNFIAAQGGLAAGSRELLLGNYKVAIPALRESVAKGVITLGIRPEHIDIRSSNDPDGIVGTVYEVEYMGSRQLVIVDTVVGRFTVRTDDDIDIKSGDQLSLALRQDHIILFDDATGRAYDSELFGEDTSSSPQSLQQASNITTQTTQATQTEETQLAGGNTYG